MQTKDEDVFNPMFWLLWLTEQINNPPVIKHPQIVSHLYICDFFFSDNMHGKDKKLISSIVAYMQLRFHFTWFMKLSREIIIEESKD